MPPTRPASGRYDGTFSVEFDESGYHYLYTPVNPVLAIAGNQGTMALGRLVTQTSRGTRLPTTISSQIAVPERYGWSSVRTDSSPAGRLETRFARRFGQWR